MNVKFGRRLCATLGRSVRQGTGCKADREGPSRSAASSGIAVSS